MTIQELIKREGGIAAFSRATGIPYRTVQNWKNEVNHPPSWLPRILEAYVKGLKK